MGIKHISPGNRRLIQSPWVRVVGVLIVIGACLGAMAFPPVRDKVQAWFVGKTDSPEYGETSKRSVELIEQSGNQGLKVSDQAAAGLELQTAPVKAATEPQPLPPQIGQVNYDNNHLFVIRPRFPGEVAELARMADGVAGVATYRNIRWGDKVKQDDLLAVIWSQQFGAAKAALVDAISALRLSRETLKRLEAIREVVPKGQLDAAARQVETDTNAYNTAERTLRMWKLPNEDIDKIKLEAKAISEQKQARDPEQEKNWARVEVKVPVFCDDPKRDLVVVEKNTNINDIVDPGRDTPLFKLADLTRLQVWVYPPPEYLPALREQLQRGPGNLKWHIRFQSDPPDTPPQVLDVEQISPSLDPNQQKPMLIGRLSNPDSKRLVGDFLTATIFLPPDRDTVEIPTIAVNQVDGQNFVFVQGVGKNEYFIRRVPVVKSFHKTTFVRSRLTPEDEAISKAEEKKGRRPLQPLQPGERVLINGVMQLTAALEESLSTRKNAD